MMMMEKPHFVIIIHVVSFKGVMILTFEFGHFCSRSNSSLEMYVVSTHGETNLQFSMLYSITELINALLMTEHIKMFLTYGIYH